MLCTANTTFLISQYGKEIKIYLVEVHSCYLWIDIAALGKKLTIWQ